MRAVGAIAALLLSIYVAAAASLSGLPLIRAAPRRAWRSMLFFLWLALRGLSAAHRSGSDEFVAVL